MKLINQNWIVSKRIDQGLLEDLFVCRGIENIEVFLNPDFSKLYDPFLMKGMAEALSRIEKAVLNNEKIVIYGDYDVDGVSSATLLEDALNEIGLTPEVFIPHRIDDGYGFNRKYIDDFKNRNISLLITVDNGITAVEEIKEARKKGLDVIVMDHHLPLETLPDAIILNPLQSECNYPDKYLCGAGIVFKFTQALKSKFPEKITENFLKWSLDLVALATVCDLAKLVGENRIFTYFGLKVLPKTKRPGLADLIRFSDIKNQEISSFDLGYKIGPRINAAGRIDSAYKAYQLLSAKRENYNVDDAFFLQTLNTERQNLVSDMMLGAYSNIDNSKNYVLVKNDTWNPGIIGLLASSIAGEFNKPAFVMCKIGKEIVGSSRSPKINLSILDPIKAQSKFLKRFGGHKAAAGFTLDEENFEMFKAGMDEYFEQVKVEDLETFLKIDLEVEKNHLNLAEAKELLKLEPFGIDNEEPIFLIKNVEIKKLSFVGDKEKHLKFLFTIENGTYSGIAFNFGKHKDLLIEANKENKKLNLVFNLKINKWQERENLDLRIIDIEIL